MAKHNIISSSTAVKTGGGGWGFYDDENDITMDYVHDIEIRVLPKKLHCDSWTVEYNKPRTRSKSKNKYKSKSKKSKRSRSKSKSKSKSKRSKKSRSKSKSKSKRSKSKSGGGKSGVMYQTDENKTCETDRWKYMAAHPQQIYKTLISELKREFKVSYSKLDKEHQRYYNGRVAGVAIFLARGWGGTPIAIKEKYKKDDQTRGIKFPTKLPKGYPSKLKSMALTASKNLQVDIEDIQRYFNTEHRMKAIHDQIALFS